MAAQGREPRNGAWSRAVTQMEGHPAALTGVDAHTYHNDTPSIQVVSMRAQADLPIGRNRR